MKDHEAIRMVIEELDHQEQKLRRLQHRKKRESREFSEGTVPWLKLHYQMVALALAANQLAARKLELKRIVEPFDQVAGQL